MPKVEDYQKTVVDVHTDEEIPSIAIIPFDNKGAKEDVFYAYGISASLKRNKPLESISLLPVVTDPPSDCRGK